MPDLWMPGAEVHDLGDHAPTDQQYPPKAIAHITWDRNATAAAPQDWVSFDSLVTYFTGSGAGAAPHIIWDPFSGRVAQLFPADSRSKSVVDAPGGTRTNRAGRVVIQIEAVFFPYCRYQGRVYPRLVDTPCAGWDRLHAWISSWGVPDVWPMGRPVDFTSHRDETTWETRGGWYAHAHVPENDHQDPGSWPDFTAPTPAPTPQEDDMPLTDTDVERVARRVVLLLAQGLAGQAPSGADDNLTWLTNWYHQCSQSSTAAVLDYKLGAAGVASLAEKIDAIPDATAARFTSGITLTVNTTPKGA
ncbi:hypothetical protein ACGF07_25415 [Kitasatospora sp. NPDC048194]|uniref:hypothetical protein n=1 Tax=Kitasatospora sp. NPDC048194 TaxID=3364045 RepID=UPI0037212C54